MLAILFSRLSVPVAFVWVLMLWLLLLPDVDAMSVRIKDICRFQDQQERELIGYGLVIGLDGTGDGNGTQFTTQSLVNMMQRMGLTVDPAKVKVKNVAAVIVTARLANTLAEGTTFDVTVSSVGDASSLQGGVLLITPLSGTDGVVYAQAQGSVSIGGFNVQVDEQNKIVNNYTLVGRIPGGARVLRPMPATSGPGNEVYLTLGEPDLTTAQRIAERINLAYGTTAYALDAGRILIKVPDSLSPAGQRARFMSDLGHLEVIPDSPARVVINERTGTIVAGQMVTIEPVAIAHGTITVNISTQPVVSQPEPFSEGRTVETGEPSISVDQQPARVVELPPSVRLSDVATALNKIGATPRDIVAIFQALKQAGALRADLVIM